MEDTHLNIKGQERTWAICSREAELKKEFSNRKKMGRKHNS